MENRLDIIITGKKEKTCLVLDVAIPADRISRKREQKINKYTRVCV
jgi:hypothetical protein